VIVGGRSRAVASCTHNLPPAVLHPLRVSSMQTLRAGGVPAPREAVPFVAQRSSSVAPFAPAAVTFPHCITVRQLPPFPPGLALVGMGTGNLGASAYDPPRAPT